jgi:hypothetical protein
LGVFESLFQVIIIKSVGAINWVYMRCIVYNIHGRDVIKLSAAVFFLQFPLKATEKYHGVIVPT